MEFDHQNFYLWETVTNGLQALNFSKQMEMDHDKEVGLFVYGPLKTEENGELYAKIKAIKVFEKTEKGEIGPEVKRIYVHVTPDEKSKELEKRQEFFQSQ